MCYANAVNEYVAAKMASDWASGLMWHIDNETALDAIQPVEYRACVETYQATRRNEHAAYEELAWYSANEPYYVTEQFFKYA